MQNKAFGIWLLCRPAPSFFVAVGPDKAQNINLCVAASFYVRSAPNARVSDDWQAGGKQKTKDSFVFLWVKNNYAQIVYPEIYYLCAQEK